MATYVQEGAAINYWPSVAVTAGDVIVIGDLVGIAKRDIAAGELGALHVEGVYMMDKDTTSGSAIAAGATVYWDDGNEVVTETSGGNTLLGKAVASSADSDAAVLVRLSQ